MLRRSLAESFAGKPPIYHSPNSQRIPILQLWRKCCIGKILETHRPCEAQDGLSTNRGKARVGSRGIWPTVDHGMTHLHASGISIEDYAANFGFEYFHQVGVVAEILIRAMNCCREMSFQLFSKLE